jgi:tetratricopeptide (TPR) repeat protein
MWRCGSDCSRACPGRFATKPSRERRARLSGEAVELARRSGNLAALAHALDARLYAIIAPDSIAECRAIGEELCDVATRIGDKERLVQGHMHLFVAYITLADLDRATKHLALLTSIANDLRQPSQLWQVRGAEAMLALAEGRLTEAEVLIAEAFTIGRDTMAAAVPHHAFQRFTLCEFRDTLSEAGQELHDVVVTHPARPVFRCALALLHAKLGGGSTAQSELNDLARDDFAGVPFDMEWLLSMSLLAETAAYLADVRSATVLYRLLLPYSALNVVDTAEGIRGSVARYLGLLAMTLHRWDAARQHFDEAVTENTRMRALPWLAHAQTDYARMLLARDDRERAYALLEQAGATYRKLGMDEYAARATALAST